MKTSQIGRSMTIVALSGLGLGVGVGCRDNTGMNETSRVSVATEALAAAIVACGQDLGACTRDAQGEPTALAACKAVFGDCRANAGAGSMNDLATAIQACTDGAGECARNAGGSEAKGCHEELVSCLGDNRPAPPEHPERDGGGGGPSGDHSAPVAACIDTLLACVEGDGSARECAQAVRACIVDAVPAPDGVIPEDPGSAADDHQPADVPPADPGMAGDAPAADAGVGMAGDPPATDAGMGMAGDPPAADAGMGMAGDVPTPSCMAQFEACVSAGGARMECARQQRECGRAKP